MTSIDRPEGYCYWEQLLDHIGSPETIFNGKLVYPRQLEIHLPSNHKVACNHACPHCAGQNFVKDLGKFEMEGLELLSKIGNRIPYHIYGGSYTEPLLNPYLLTYLAMTKRVGAHFGIHTNGSALLSLENWQGWLTELARISTDKTDYLSISLDAGFSSSHCKVKGVKEDFFSQVLSGIELMSEIRKDKPALRLCYLMNHVNTSQREIDRVVSLAKALEVDSLRFSLPFAHYNLPFKNVQRYRDGFEQSYKDRYYRLVEKHLSKSRDELPFVFWMGPDEQDISLYDYQQCAYSYYQICIGADGYYYRCTTISTPSFQEFRLGKVTANLEDFNKALLLSQNPAFDCKNCFKIGARCNRMGLSINRKFAELKEQPEVCQVLI